MHILNIGQQNGQILTNDEGAYFLMLGNYLTKKMKGFSTPLPLFNSSHQLTDISYTIHQIFKMSYNSNSNNSYDKW